MECILIALTCWCSEINHYAPASNRNEEFRVDATFLRKQKTFYDEYLFQNIDI